METRTQPFGPIPGGSILTHTHLRGALKKHTAPMKSSQNHTPHRRKPSRRVDPMPIRDRACFHLQPAGNSPSCVGAYAHLGAMDMPSISQIAQSFMWRRATSQLRRCQHGIETSSSSTSSGPHSFRLYPRIVFLAWLASHLGTQGTQGAHGTKEPRSGDPGLDHFL